MSGEYLGFGENPYLQNRGSGLRAIYDFGEDNNSNDSMESGFKFENILPSGGAGLRFLLFQEKDIYLRLDYGITGHGNNYYITLGEAF